MNVIDLITAHEGYRQYPYTCPAGKLTIGIGRNIEDRGITREEAQFLLANDIASAEKELRQAFPWFGNLTRPRRYALIDLVVNMGLPTLREFTKTLEYLERGDFDAAAAELLRGSGPDGKSQYYHQVGQRAERISNIIRHGVMPA